MGYDGVVGKETQMTEKMKPYTLVAILEFADGGVHFEEDYGDFANEGDAEKAAKQMARFVKAEMGGKITDFYAQED